MIIGPPGGLNRFLGGEKQPGPSSPDLVQDKNIVKFPAMFKERIRFFDALFKTVNPKPCPIQDISQKGTSFDIKIPDNQNVIAGQNIVLSKISFG